MRKTELFHIDFESLPEGQRESLEEALEVPGWLLDILTSPQYPWTFDGFSPEGLVSVAREAQDLRGGFLLDGGPARLDGALVHVPLGENTIFLYRPHAGRTSFEQFIRTRRMALSKDEIALRFEQS